MKCILLCLVLAAPAMILFAEEGGPFYQEPGAIGINRVCQALAVVGDACSHDVELLGQAAPFGSGTTLRVTRRIPATFGEQVTLRCDDGSCLPFLAILHHPSHAAAVPLKRVASQRIPSFAVRPGDVAQMVQQGDGIRLVRSVVCMERGRIGDTIRVRESGRGAQLRALVVRPGILAAAYE